MATLSVFATVGHVLIVFEPIPAIEKDLIISYRHSGDVGQQRDNARGIQEQKIILIETRYDVVDLQTCHPCPRQYTTDGKARRQLA